MTNGKNYLVTIAGVSAIAMLVATAPGCRPAVVPTPPRVPVVTAPVVRAPQPAPTYRPTTEEWVRMPVRLIYPTGGSRLSDENRAMLREAQASMAHRTDIVRVRVEGHADSRGNEEQNQRLSEERARAVIDYMVGDLGLPRELFESQGFGSTRPITSETTASDRVQNRRVEFSILVRRQAAP